MYKGYQAILILCPAIIASLLYLIAYFCARTCLLPAFVFTFGYVASFCFLSWREAISALSKSYSRNNLPRAHPLQLSSRYAMHNSWSFAVEMKEGCRARNCRVEISARYFRAHPDFQISVNSEGSRCMYFT